MPKQRAWLKSIRQKKAFNKLLIMFERQCPAPTSRGFHRPKFNIISFVKKMEAIRGVKTEWIAYKMTWSAFRVWATKETSVALEVSPGTPGPQGLTMTISSVDSSNGK